VFIAAAQDDWQDRGMSRARHHDAAPPKTAAPRAWPASFADFARDVLAARVDALRPLLRRDASHFDAADIHLLRAQVRRLRSSLWLLRPLDDDRLTEVERRARRVVRALGAVRDIDEQLRRIGPRGAIATDLERRRRRALQAARQSLRRNAARQWHTELAAAAADRDAWRTPVGQADASAVVAALIRERRRRLKRHLKRLDRHAPQEQFHAARRRAKQFADALDDIEPQLRPVSAPLRRSVQRLRSALGRLQDAVVAEAEFVELTRRFPGDRALQRRLRRLSADNRAARRRAMRRSLRVAGEMSPAHWRRVRDALGPPADLERLS
jgi:CHAD domain-containing protein